MSNITLIERKSSWIVDKEYHCEITDAMDQFLVGGEQVNGYRTYILDYGDRKGFDGNPGHVYSIRVPGATRGSIITTPDGIIESILLSEDTCFTKLVCYDRKVIDVVKKFIGMKIIYQ